MIERRPYDPRPYQHLITKHEIENERCAVWAGMGLGKSVATLTALDLLILAGESHPALILGPKRVARRVWSTEAAKWAHLRHISIMPIIGSEAERLGAMKRDASVYTCNYENLPWLVQHYGERWPFRTVVSDESTRLKGFRVKQGTTRARALGSVAHTKIKRFIQLTGTPSPNGLADLWGQAWFLDAGARLGRTYEAFRQRWFQKSFDGYSVDPLPYTQTEIQDRLRDICLSINASDYFDIEAPIVNDIFVDMPVRARLKYREMERDMFAEIDGHEIEAFNAAARTQKLLQLANGAAYVDTTTESPASRERAWVEVHDGKLDALESIVEEAGGMPVLCSYEFVSDRKRILKRFPGSVDLATDAGFDTFLKGKSPLGIAHPKSMGHGIDGLQDVTNIIAYFSSNWDLELDMQILERIGPVRQLQSGYCRPVFVHRIMARDTVDELVAARRETKREVQDILLDAMKARS